MTARRATGGSTGGRVMKVDGAVALVTGASSGIGAATAVELARRGATDAAQVARGVQGRAQPLVARARGRLARHWRPRRRAQPGTDRHDIWDNDETPSSYRERRYPPETVAKAVVRMIERELVHLTVPRRFGAVGPIYALPELGRLVRRGLVGFEHAGERRRQRQGET